MAVNLWFSVIVLITIQQVFARDCSNIESILNCNECIRCGGHWCNKPAADSHCSLILRDNWCPDYQEALPAIKDVNKPGKTVNYIYSERTVNVEKPNIIRVIYNGAAEPKIDMIVVNTTQNLDFKVTSKTKCKDNECTTFIEALPGKDFCSSTGRIYELVNVSMNIDNISEGVALRYHVPCACECSEKVEKNSKFCNGRGDFSCGVCTCHNGWTGEFCELTCKEKRGDLQCSNPAMNQVECSGNGYCNPCETCECYTDREGWQYFDKDNYCADLCMTTSDCDDCLLSPTPGLCEDCQYPIIIQPYNKTLMGARDEFNRTVWVKCNEKQSEECNLAYAAMKDENDDIYVMVIDSCEAVSAAYVPGGVNVTVPAVLGVIAIVAAVAAAAGYMVWKNRTPPLPLTDPEYCNIDAEDCTGENPLYKPPTSSFKNPTYGKW